MTTSSNNRLLELRLNKIELYITELQAIDLKVLLHRLKILTSTTLEVLSSEVPFSDPLFQRLEYIIDDFTLPYKFLQYKVYILKALLDAKKAMMIDTLNSYEIANEKIDSLYLRITSENVEKGQLVLLQEYRCRIKLLLSRFLNLKDSFMLHSKVNRILNEIGDSMSLSTLSDLKNLQTKNPIRNVA